MIYDPEKKERLSAYDNLIIDQAIAMINFVMRGAPESTSHEIRVRTIEDAIGRPHGCLLKQEMLDELSDRFFPIWTVMIVDPDSYNPIIRFQLNSFRSENGLKTLITSAA